ncbi:MAG TPA: metallophosphoesterase [Streptosporangiaceae bacterium]|nr:metallophosphoesterase [Streptosporangiaceae bacterium]
MSVRVLAVSDEVDDGLAGGLAAGWLVDLILACGDLPADYLAALINAIDVPLVFVPGNHDPDLSGYRQSRSGLVTLAGFPAAPPWPPGALSADGQVLDAAGLRVAGLGGCLRYSAGPNQYTERQQARRARRLRNLVRRRSRRDHRQVDVVLTHAPPSGIGDADDLPHRGFGCYHQLIADLAPSAMLHGHVVPGRTWQRTVGPAVTGQSKAGRTTVCNVTGWRLLEITPGGLTTWQEGRRRAI